MNRQKITTIVLCALFAAITAVLSQIAIPMPSGVPVTLQTFAIALCGFYLCTARATVSTVVYVLLGAVVGIGLWNCVKLDENHLFFLLGCMSFG